jgi:hypothetical protein
MVWTALRNDQDAVAARFAGMRRAPMPEEIEGLLTELNDGLPPTDEELLWVLQRAPAAASEPALAGDTLRPASPTGVRTLHDELDELRAAVALWYYRLAFSAEIESQDTANALAPRAVGGRMITPEAQHRAATPGPFMHNTPRESLDEHGNLTLVGPPPPLSRCSEPLFRV